MNASTRIEFHPLNGPYFVLTNIGVYLDSNKFEFGSAVPEYIPLHVQFHMHQNGVIGTKDELEALNDKPIELSVEDPFYPIAKFVSHPAETAEIADKKEETGGQEFHIENAKLFKTKDQIIEYAKLFNIKLAKKDEKNKDITMKVMLETLEAKAKEAGLVK